MVAKNNRLLLCKCFFIQGLPFHACVENELHLHATWRKDLSSVKRAAFRSVSSSSFSKIVEHILWSRAKLLKPSNSLMLRKLLNSYFTFNLTILSSFMDHVLSSFIFNDAFEIVCVFFSTKKEELGPASHPWGVNSPLEQPAITH